MIKFLKGLFQRKPPAPEPPALYICHTCTRTDVKWRNLTKQFVNDRMVTGPQAETCFLFEHDMEPVDVTSKSKLENNPKYYEAVEYDTWLQGGLNL